MNRLLILSTLLILTACAAPVTAAPTAVPSHTSLPPSTLTAAPTATATPSPTITPTATPTLIVTPVATISPIITSPLPQSVLEQFWFTDETDPDCQLPCWNGLVVGQSTPADAQEVLDRVFELNGTRTFFPEPIEVNGRQVPEGFYVADPIWRFDKDSETGSGLFGVVVRFDVEQLILRDISIRWISSDSFQLYRSPKQIIQEFGQPDYVFIELQQTERTDAASWRAFIIYKNGVTIGYTDLLYYSEVETEAGTMWRVEVCLGDPLEDGQIHILEPLTDGFDNLTPLQQYMIGDVPDKYLPIQDFFDMSLEEITALAIEDQNACLTRDFLKR